MSKLAIFLMTLFGFTLAAVCLYLWGLLEDNGTAVFVGGTALQLFLVVGLLLFFFDEVFSYLKKRKKEVNK